MPIDPRRRAGRRQRKSFDHGEPIRWISLVPLAGIFAIAGALLASTYGLTPHALTVDLPAPDPSGDAGPLTPNVDRLVIEPDGALFWNGTELDDDELTELLADPRYRESGAALLFTPDAKTSYARALEVLEIIREQDAIGRCFRFSGIARYRRYENLESFEELVPHTREDCAPFPT